METVQTLLRLLLEEQSDLGLHCLNTRCFSNTEDLLFVLNFLFISILVRQMDGLTIDQMIISFFLKGITILLWL